jgi:hypothetical protein
LIDVLAATTIGIDDRLLEVDLSFPIRFELHYWRTPLGWRIRGY